MGEEQKKLEDMTPEELAAWMAEAQAMMATYSAGLLEQKAGHQKAIDAAAKIYKEDTEEHFAEIKRLEGLLKGVPGYVPVVEKKKAAVARGGAKLRGAEWINKMDIGTEFRSSEFQEGSAILSGYAGVLLREWTNAGYLTQEAKGKPYKVAGIIPVE